MNIFRLAVVGLDSSHAIEFTRLFQTGTDAVEQVKGIQIISYSRFPSIFQSEEDQDLRARQLQDWGVSPVDSPEDAVSAVDGFLVTLNNPADHRAMMERLIPLGKPIFLDKPVADTSENAQAIYKMAKEYNLSWWSSSAVPLVDSVARIRRQIPAPTYVHVYGPLGKAAAGSDVVWYGCHTFESLIALLGTGAESVQAIPDSRRIIVRVNYADERSGMVELISGAWRYGGRAENKDAGLPFQYDPVCDAPIYLNIAHAIRDFFHFGKIAFPLANTLEASALAAATDESLSLGGQRVKL